MTVKTIAELFGIEYPLIQAPMAGVQTSALCIAVSNAGGLGSLPCAMLTPEAMRAEFELIRKSTDKPYNVNFFCHTPPVSNASQQARWLSALSPYYREFHIALDTPSTGSGRAPFDELAADLLAEFKPAVVSFHFGLPAPSLLARVRESGAKILSSATTVNEALWLQDHGVNAIIAQGLEAGGHRGTFLTDDMDSQLGSFALVPQIVDRVNVPVIAAGGLAGPREIAAAMQLGAAGVQIGTSYLLATEATTSAVHRAALKVTPVSTALTNVFSGRPARGIVNRTMRELGPMSHETPEFPLASGAIAPLRRKAEAAGSGDFSPMWCGQNASGCREAAAFEITRALAEGFKL